MTDRDVGEFTRDNLKGKESSCVNCTGIVTSNGDPKTRRWHEATEMSVAPIAPTLEGRGEASSKENGKSTIPYPQWPAM